MAQQSPVYDPQSDERGVPRRQRDIMPDSVAAGNPTDPRSSYDPQKTPMGDSSDLRSSLSSAEKGGGLYNAAGDSNASLSSLEGVASKFGGAGNLTSLSGIRSAMSGFLSKPGKKKKVIFGGSIVTIVVTSIAISFLATGPLELVHLSQLMKGFHFANMEDTQDGRMTKLYRYARDPDMPQNTRMGKYGNKMADKFEAKMNKTGIESQYTKNFGFGDGYAVNLDNERYEGKNTNQARKEIAKTLGVDEKYLQVGADSSGKRVIKIDSKSMSYRQQVKLNRTILREAGYSRVSAAIGSRVMGHRAGLTWHPIKKADQKILEGGAEKVKELREKWRKDSVSYIRDGNTAVATKSTKDVPTDEDGNPVEGHNDGDADKAQQSIDEATADGDSANAGTTDGDAQAQTKFQDKLGVKLTAGGLGAVGIVCIAKGLGDNIDQLRTDRVIMPMIRMAMQAMSIGSQAQSGEDISATQLGIAREDLHEKNAKGRDISSWDQAKSIQYESGRTMTGTDISASAKVFNKSNPLGFVSDIKGIGPVCDAAGSTVGQALGFALSGGPLSAITSLALDKWVVGPALQSLASWMAGDAINPLAQGAMRGNYINYGARLAANDQAVAAGATALSTSDELALDQASRSARQDEFNSKSFAYRMFNVEDSKSLAAKVIDSQPSGTSQGVANMASSFGEVFASALRVPASIFTQKARAADGSYDYGFEAYGFSEQDQRNSEVENPYKNAKRAAEILDADTDNTYKDRAKKCFGAEISNSDGWDVSYGEGITNLYDGNYPDECSENSSEWLSIRFFILDTQTMKSAACFEGEDDACSSLGVSESGSSSDSSGGTVSGNVQELAQQILDNSKITYPLDSSSPNGSTKEVLEALAAGKEAPVTCTGGSTKVNVGILKFLVELGQEGPVGVNAITDKCHSTGSNHYLGKAVDFECGAVPFNTAVADKIAAKYGGARNGETCSGNAHWHYDFLQ